MPRERIVDMLVPTMARKKKPPQKPPDERVIVVVLKDNKQYRDWIDGLSDATLIPVAAIFRDAVAKWAEERGLPAPPASSVRRRRHK